jgi:hypothetical protein
MVRIQHEAGGSAVIPLIRGYPPEASEQNRSGKLISRLTGALTRRYVSLPNDIMAVDAGMIPRLKTAGIDR